MRPVLTYLRLQPGIAAVTVQPLSAYNFASGNVVVRKTETGPQLPFGGLFYRQANPSTPLVFDGLSFFYQKDSLFFQTNNGSVYRLDTGGRLQSPGLVVPGSNSISDTGHAGVLLLNSGADPENLNAYEWAFSVNILSWKLEEESQTKYCPVAQVYPVQNPIPTDCYWDDTLDWDDSEMWQDCVV